MSHAPASLVHPDLTPTTPFVPTRGVYPWTAPTRGRTTDGLPTIAANAGVRMAW